ncbi:MAG TPA: DUF711 family protein [Terriglobales bacterium]|nr:DUF711 family protein [Terriglobales bacterium]
MMRTAFKYSSNVWQYVAALLMLAGCMAAQAQPAASSPATARPNVRAITAFVRLDRTNYKQQVADALSVLGQARRAFEQRGYTVQSVRITTQPFPDYVRGLSREQALAFFREYDDFLKAEGKRQRIEIAPNIGPAMLNDNDDPAMADLLGEVLSTTSLNASLHVAGDDGIHWKSVRAAAHVIKYAEEHSPNSQGTFNFAATAMLQPYAPFFPGSYHSGAGKQFSIGFEGAGLVAGVFAVTREPHAATDQLTRAIAAHARVADEIGNQVQKSTGWKYMGFDPTPAPLKDVSIGAAIESFTGARFGSSGTLLAASVITQAVKAVPVKQVGYAGLMLPVMEDARLAQRWTEGTYNLDSLLAYSAVCGTGLDTIPLPGEVTEEQMARIIGDMAALAFKWHKPLSARLQPETGKKAGDMTAFDDPYLVNAKIHPLPE